MGFFFFLVFFWPRKTLHGSAARGYYCPPGNFLRPPPYLHGRRARLFRTRATSVIGHYIYGCCKQQQYTVCYYGSCSSCIPTRPISRPIGRRGKKGKKRRKNAADGQKKSPRRYLRVARRPTSSYTAAARRVPNPFFGSRVRKSLSIFRFSFPAPVMMGFFFLLRSYIVLTVGKHQGRVFIRFRGAPGESLH